MEGREQSDNPTRSNGWDDESAVIGPASFAATKEELEVTQTGETCPVKNLNMGKLSCPPAAGWGGVRSQGKEGKSDGRRQGKEI